MFADFPQVGHHSSLLHSSVHLEHDHDHDDDDDDDDDDHGHDDDYDDDDDHGHDYSSLLHSSVHMEALTVRSTLPTNQNFRYGGAYLVTPEQKFGRYNMMMTMLLCLRSNDDADYLIRVYLVTL